MAVILVGWYLPRPRPLTTHQLPASEHGLAAFGRLHRYDTRRRHSYLGQRSPSSYEDSLNPTSTTRVQPRVTPCPTSGGQAGNTAARLSPL